MVQYVQVALQQVTVSGSTGFVGYAAIGVFVNDGNHVGVTPTIMGSKSSRTV